MSEVLSLSQGGLPGSLWPAAEGGLGHRVGMAEMQ